MAQFAVLIYSDDSAHEPGQDADTSADIAECDDHADELVGQAATSQVVMTHAWALTPRSHARSVRVDGVTDGPFVNSAQVVAGFYLLEAPDLEAAIATAATNPVVVGSSGVEVRPVHSGGAVHPS